MGVSNLQTKRFALAKFRREDVYSKHALKYFSCSL